MKRAFAVASLIGIVVLGAVTAYGFIVPRMKVDLGFSFYVGKDLMPAGRYWVEVGSHPGSVATGSNIILRAETGDNVRFLPVVCVDSERQRFATHLEFRKIGDNYFLSHVHQGTIRATMPKSKLERELTAAAIRGKGEISTVNVAALRE